MTKLINYCAGALISILCVSFVGCNEPNEQEQPEPPELVGIVPVPASDIPDEVAAFFEKYLPPISGFDSELFFVDDNEDKCLIINSDKELQAIMYSSVELPSIDFDKHTLIIGQYIVLTTSYHVLSQNIDIESNPITLNLSLKIPEAAYQAVSEQYYWGLYPKLSETVIDVNVIYEQ